MARTLAWDYWDVLSGEGERDASTGPLYSASRYYAKPEESVDYQEAAREGTRSAPNYFGRTSQAGRDFIKSFEGEELKAYLDSAGVPTIGYGHTRTVTRADVKNGKTITREEANRLFDQDLEHFEKAVRDQVKVDLTDSQFDSLVSFAYNLGEGNLKKVVEDVNAGNFKKAAERMAKFNKARNPKTGKLEERKGLTRRRQAEVAMFSDGRYPNGTGKSVAEDTNRDHIRAAQSALNDVLGTKLAEDGISGPKTREAVKQFQESQGLKATGKLDPDTLDRLNESQSLVQQVRTENLPGAITSGIQSLSKAQGKPANHLDQAFGFSLDKTKTAPTMASLPTSAQRNPYETQKSTMPTRVQRNPYETQRGGPTLKGTGSAQTTPSASSSGSVEFQQSMPRARPRDPQLSRNPYETQQTRAPTPRARPQEDVATPRSRPRDPGLSQPVYEAQRAETAPKPRSRPQEKTTIGAGSTTSGAGASASSSASKPLTSYDSLQGGGRAGAGASANASANRTVSKSQGGLSIDVDQPVSRVSANANDRIERALSSDGMTSSERYKAGSAASRIGRSHEAAGAAGPTISEYAMSSAGATQPTLRSSATATANAGASANQTGYLSAGGDLGAPQLTGQTSQAANSRIAQAFEDAAQQAAQSQQQNTTAVGKSSQPIMAAQPAQEQTPTYQAQPQQAQAASSAPVYQAQPQQTQQATSAPVYQGQQQQQAQQQQGGLLSRLFGGGQQQQQQQGNWIGRAAGTAIGTALAGPVGGYLGNRIAGSDWFDRTRYANGYSDIAATMTGPGQYRTSTGRNVDVTHDTSLTGLSPKERSEVLQAIRERGQYHQQQRQGPVYSLGRALTDSANRRSNSSTTGRSDQSSTTRERMEGGQYADHPSRYASTGGSYAAGKGDFGGSSGPTYTGTSSGYSTNREREKREDRLGY